MPVFLTWWAMNQAMVVGHSAVFEWATELRQKYVRMQLSQTSSHYRV